MRDYQRKKGKYILPAAVYHQVIWQVRDYYRLKDMAEAVCEESAGMGDGMPHGSPSPDGVFNKATRRMEYTRITDAIDAELAKIPKEYQRGVWNNIHYSTAFPMDAGRTTYSNYKSRFIYQIAVRLGLYEDL
ncbi:MAG: hypothetical protein J6U42_05815 [Lachnospiraceae bacterium]|nr:hypothetical protein [Lachnospiraceae bacterium]